MTVVDTYVLDASALIAYYNDEDGAERVQELLDQAARSEAFVQMSAVNVCEVYYDCLRIAGHQRADELL